MVVLKLFSLIMVVNVVSCGLLSCGFIILGVDYLWSVVLYINNVNVNEELLVILIYINCLVLIV